MGVPWRAIRRSPSIRSERRLVANPNTKKPMLTRREILRPLKHNLGHTCGAEMRNPDFSCSTREKRLDTRFFGLAVTYAAARFTASTFFPSSLYSQAPTTVATTISNSATMLVITSNRTGNKPRG